MAKKIKLISQIFLGVATALTLSFASMISPAHACLGSDGSTDTATNCADIDAATPAIEALDETLSDVYFSAEPELKSETTVDHSLFLAGNQVASKDVVNGLVALAGNFVEHSGYSHYAALAGNYLAISGQITNDLFAAGNSVTITEDAHIGRDVFAFGNIVTLSTNLSGNAFLGGDRLVLDSVTIDGDLTADFSEIVIKGKTAISGTFKYNGTATVTGLENLTAGASETYKDFGTEKSFAVRLQDKLIMLVGRIVLTIVVVALAPKFAKKLTEKFSFKDSWKDLALGLGALVLVPLVALFAVITVVGVPIGLVALVLYGLLAYFSHSATGVVLGDVLAKLLKKEKMNMALKATMGVSAVGLLALVPFIGGLIKAVSVCFGFGYLFRLLFIKEKAQKS